VLLIAFCPQILAEDVNVDNCLIVMKECGKNILYDDNFALQCIEDNINKVCHRFCLFCDCFLNIFVSAFEE
jgi:hypothetical protein